MSKYRKAFNFYRSYFEVARELPKKDKADFLWAILERQFEGKEPELNGLAKFAYISQKHSIDQQVRGWEDKTGLKLDPMQGGSEGGSEGPLVQVQEKEKGEDKGEGQGQDVQKFVFRKALLDLNVDPQIADDWIKVRKDKKASNTRTALARIYNEVISHGLEFPKVIEICAQNSWAGFKAEWLINQNQQTTKTVLL